MDDLHFIVERLKENEAIARKFFQVETRILSILNFTDLFNVLLSEIKDKFQVPLVWLSLIDGTELMELVESRGLPEILKDKISTLDRHTFAALLGDASKPLLVNDNLKHYFKLLPPSRFSLFKSMAITPISLDGQIIGSFNQADYSPFRFMPGMDTIFLEQLAVKISLCISNVAAHEKLCFLAYHDPLTGLLNRRVAEAILKREFARAQRYANALSVAFLDLDDFKLVNDTHGHDCGDALLKFVADSLEILSRETDVVARFAGDEFVIILPETSGKDALKLMNRLQIYFTAHPFKGAPSPVTVSVSFGVAALSDGPFENPAMLLKKADERLYQVKGKRKRAKIIDSVKETDTNVIQLPLAAGKDEGG